MTNLSLRDRALIDPKFFIESLVSITDKDRNVVPFIFNEAQNQYYDNRTRRDVILKPRQLGFSTLILGLFLHDTLFVPNTVSIIVCHTQKDSSALFERCVHPDVETLEANGFPKKISESGTSTIRWDGDLISIQVRNNPNHPIIVTPDHKILTEKGWKQARYITLSDRIAFDKKNITGKLKSIFINTELMCRKLLYNGVNEAKIDLNEEFGWVVGILLAEGYVEKDKNRGSNIIFTLNKKEQLFGERIKRFFETCEVKIRGKVKLKVKNNVLRVELLSEVWRRFFRETFYVDSDGNEKYIPDWIFDANKDFCTGLVRGLIDGDGHNLKNRKANSYGSSRPQLAYQLRDIICALGYGWSSIRKSKDNRKKPLYSLTMFGSTFAKYSKLDRKCRKVSFIETNDYIYQKIKKIESIYYKGQLYDKLNQPNNQYRTVSGIIHNSKFMFDSIAGQPLPAPVFQPHVKYSNRLELYFDKINSTLTIGSAETRDFGRGRTINNLHLSEVSSPSFTEDFLIGLLESVPRTGHVVLESTARGEGGPFYDYYMGAKNPFRPKRRVKNEYFGHYFVWHKHSEYKITDLTEEQKSEILTSLDEEEVALIERFGLTVEQLAWRREKKFRMGAKFVQEYPEDDDEEVFLKSGTPVFDNIKLNQIDKNLVEQFPAEIWLGGDMYVYRMAQPGAKYVVGADVAEGDPHSDYSAAMVLRTFPLPIEQVGLLVGRWTPDIFSEKLWRLGKAYNNAVLAVERNNHGHAVILNLANGIVRRGAVAYPAYPNIYVGPDRKMGWLTSNLSRPQMIDLLDKAIRMDEMVIQSKRFIEQAKRFSYLAKMKTGGSKSPDDIVLANAIALIASTGGEFTFEFV